MQEEAFGLTPSPNLSPKGGEEHGQSQCARTTDATDLAKIGQLVLDRGRWHGQRILPETWISIMTAPQIVRPKTTYGFLWWLDREQVNSKEVDIISGYGWGGQSISVVPSLGLVVAVNAGVYDFDGQGSQNIASTTALDAALQATTGN